MKVTLFVVWWFFAPAPGHYYTESYELGSLSECIQLARQLEVDKVGHPGRYIDYVKCQQVEQGMRLEAHIDGERLDWDNEHDVQSVR